MPRSDWLLVFWLVGSDATPARKISPGGRIGQDRIVMVTTLLVDCVIETDWVPQLYGNVVNGAGIRIMPENGVKKYIVRLSADEREALEAVISKGKHPASLDP